ncbi:hypothetical protein HYH03_008529 [Edaphochlamys debaryana]|uniref:BTB domain-containing protein n=1 Tax=Edaphochlamys debaryana TaxID=47281 RepID=A0A835Y1A3_9CHLO|nr:hypothetical protein HYH03_008529 [Edaphochlamys debaryana]|eukprot:KAG2493402.1 hypothetical protein HYH03_008529 [Edaphochlamys debaryana]
MTLVRRCVKFEKEAWGLVVRPRPGGGPDQALVLLRWDEFDEEAEECYERGSVHELEVGGAGHAPTLGPLLVSLGEGGSHPTYDPATGAVYFSPTTWGRDAISKLDASNEVSAVVRGPGPKGQAGRPQSCFNTVFGMVADGDGSLWVNDCSRMHCLDVHSWKATAAAEGPSTCTGWTCLALDPVTGMLLAASNTALCCLHTEDDGWAELLAGDWEESGSIDGSGTAARFTEMFGILPVSGGRLLIADDADLRCMDAGGAVTTLLRGCFKGPEEDDLVGVTQMALLPSGELGAVLRDGSLALISGGDFAPAAQQPIPRLSPASTDRLLSLLAPPAAEEGAGGSSGGDAVTQMGSATASGAVTVRVGNRAFLAHRSVLAAGSEYFARLLAPGGGFEESCAAEVTLPDADPAAFAHLMSYMYGTSLRLPGASSALRTMPPELLRPAAALAWRLSMGGAVAALTPLGIQRKRRSVDPCNDDDEVMSSAVGNGAGNRKHTCSGLTSDVSEAASE